MNRQHIAQGLRVLALASVGLAFFATVQFIRGKLPNPSLFFFPAPEPITGAFASMQWLLDFYGWVGGVGFYLALGLLCGYGFSMCSRIVEVGWAQYREEQKTIADEYAAWAKVEHARTERRRLRDIARAKGKPSSIGSVLFGVFLGWLFFR